MMPGPIISLAVWEIQKMRHFGSMLFSVRSRIGRHLAEIVAIAAASLPAAGA